MNALVTMEMIEWRDSELADVVAFLEVSNPHGYSAENIKAHAYRAFADGGYKPTFVGTAGWYVSIVPKGYASGWIALVSIMGFSAKRYMEEMQELRRDVARYYDECEERFKYETNI